MTQLMTNPHFQEISMVYDSYLVSLCLRLGDLNIEGGLSILQLDVSCNTKWQKYETKKETNTESTFYHYCMQFIQAIKLNMTGRVEEQ